MARSKVFFLCLFLYGYVFNLNIYAQKDTINKLNQEGLKTGYWIQYYPNQKIRYEGYFSKGQPVGLMKRYFKNGNLSASIVFHDNNQTSTATLYYENGKKAATGKYLGKKKDSIWNYYSFYNNRLTISEEWKSGKRDGITQKFYDDGKTAEKTEWKNGEQHGKWEQYYENGVLRLQSSYSHGLRQGNFQSFNPDGTPFIKGFYQNNLMDGNWVYYNPGQADSICVEYAGGKMLPNQRMQDKKLLFSRELKKIIKEYPETGER